MDVDHVEPEGSGIYVHVPFCARRCGYCAFVTVAPGDAASAEVTARRWADAAVAEIEAAGRELDVGRSVSTVYFGGGTPTAVPPALLGEVLGAVDRSFDVDRDVEISVEANPDGLRSGQVAELAALGITRISFGMQSAVPRVLDLLDRTHDVDSVPRAVTDAREAGIGSVSLDLIHGTPGETADDWERTLDVALGLAPDHLSAYALSIETGTKLAARVRAGALPEPSTDEAAERYVVLDERAAAAGLSWYELSNWASDHRHRCRHNVTYWTDGDWLGVGPGAHSHLAGRRWWNHAALTTWSDAALEGRSPVAGSERTTEDERRTERIMLGMRTTEGIPVTWAAVGSVAELVDDGLVEQRDERVVLTLRGRLLADLVIRRLRWGR